MSICDRSDRGFRSCEKFKITLQLGLFSRNFETAFAVDVSSGHGAAAATTLSRAHGGHALARPGCVGGGESDTAAPLARAVRSEKRAWAATAERGGARARLAKQKRRPLTASYAPVAPREGRARLRTRRGEAPGLRAARVAARGVAAVRGLVHHSTASEAREKKASSAEAEGAKKRRRAGGRRRRGRMRGGLDVAAAERPRGTASCAANAREEGNGDRPRRRETKYLPARRRTATTTSSNHPKTPETSRVVQVPRKDRGERGATGGDARRSARRASDRESGGDGRCRGGTGAAIASASTDAYDALARQTREGARTRTATTVGDAGEAARLGPDLRDLAASRGVPSRPW